MNRMSDLINIQVQKYFSHSYLPYCWIRKQTLGFVIWCSRVSCLRYISQDWFPNVSEYAKCIDLALQGTFKS